MVENNHMQHKSLANIEEIIARSGRVLVITDTPLDLPCPSLLVPKADPLLSPILFGVVGQLLAYHAARALGCPIDQPRNLAKSVTVE